MIKIFEGSGISQILLDYGNVLKRLTKRDNTLINVINWLLWNIQFRPKFCDVKRRKCNEKKADHIPVVEFHSGTVRNGDTFYAAARICG